MDGDGFAEAIAGLVERHPVLYYRMKLEDSHIPLHVVERDFFGDTFLEVFRQYDNALFESVRLMIRYEKSLKAWGGDCRGDRRQGYEGHVGHGLRSSGVHGGVRSAQRVQRPACPRVRQARDGCEGRLFVSSERQKGLVWRNSGSVRWRSAWEEIVRCR